jgi:hypothetical protein
MKIRKPHVYNRHLIKAREGCNEMSSGYSKTIAEEKKVC